ncbi:MAG: cobalt/nickel transport system ATP-binding protein [Methanobacterium sp.]|jgi:cobalt/nickel transport system ATP-binding protein|uniref:ATP-binding cassette domain-containing protein n=1 Tax=Methanobacterium sp. TaxID=2164 RepID=UPI0003C92BF7|nr:ATP-binding cassette domain-containing protein [Methanobacterium sp.]MDI3550541.1 cobalt/nickel transport system ATP-binding protein [Methanobacterium sp.]CDG64770.1 putative ABC transporter ATP-binding protein MTBMA_c05830 [Methanobacterium sp. MB1]
MNVLETKNVSYQYPDGTPALENVNFTVARGKMVALLGPNGAGKSTLFLHFNGILRPSSGTVMVEGVPLTYDKKSIMKVRQKVGIVFQNPDDQLFAPTVEEDVAFGPLNVGLDPDEVEKRVAESLEKVGMSGFEKKPPHHLSGGQKKRVAIAGILAMRPDIMVLDEPTSGLDPRGASHILHLLHRLNQEGMTIVISTHDVDLVPLYASQVYIISEGHIIKAGTPQDVFSDVETIRNANLRLPRIAHLMEILQKKDELPFTKPYPLTIGEARKKLLKEFDE